MECFQKINLQLLNHEPLSHDLHLCSRFHLLFHPQSRNRNPVLFHGKKGVTIQYANNTPHKVLSFLIQISSKLQNLGAQIDL